MKAVALNRLSLLLSFAGIFVAGVLSIGKYYSVSLPCGSSHGCDIVARHPSAQPLGIPTAYIGLLAYVVFAALSAWRLFAPASTRPALILGYVFSAFGALTSLVLTYIAIAVIKATCIWCLTSAGLMIALLIVHSLLMQAPPVEKSEPSILNAILAIGLVPVTLIALTMEGMTIVSEQQPNVNTKLPIEMYIPEDAHIYGNPSAPVTIVEFGDLLCPACQLEYSKVKDFIGLHSGKVNYVFREFPMLRMQGHEQSTPAAIIAEIASEKGMFWNFVDAMYQKPMGEPKDTQPILDIAQSLGFDSAKLLERMRDDKDPAFKRLMRDLDQGSKIGVKGTPTFFIVVRGSKAVRASAIGSLFDDLERPEYTKFYKSG
ncbi:MAG TPA: vitamin K epoxide reductase family protein [Fimbriimonadaceae bacterium]|nr:vitamin K epoxide reductase family protein [Fimbriimonadaceae bacterium]